MSRLKRYAHSLFSGYIQLGATAVYMLASLPLASHYLPDNAEFSLWTLTSSIISCIMLVDLGLAGSASRILIDYKDRRAGGEFGGIVQTTAAVGLVQGGIVCVAGFLIALVAGRVMNVHADLRPEFFWLVAGQSAITAVTMATRIFNLLLSAHQRFDVNNYAGTAALLLNFVTMWGCFRAGFGIYGLLAGQAVALGLNLVVSAWMCRRLGLFPGPGEWGRPAWTKFRELFSFAQDVFLYNMGSQLVGFSQAPLLSRLANPDAVTAWNNVKTFNLLTQIIYKVFDFSSPALAEMMVRDERERLKHRFRQIVELSMSLAVVAGVMYAVGNHTFVRLWMHDRLLWPRIDDVLMGLWLVLCVSVHAHTGLVGQSKVFRFMRFIFLIEGGTFIGLMFSLHWLGAMPPNGPGATATDLHSLRAITVMLLLSIGCGLTCSCAYGLHRTRGYFGMTWRELLGWHLHSFRLAAVVVPVAAAAWWVIPQTSLPWQLAAIAGTGLWGLFALLRFGLPVSLHGELARRLPFLGKLIGAPT